MSKPLELVTRLVDVADAMVEPRPPDISDSYLRSLKEQVHEARMRIAETDFAVDYEASCLIDCIAALAYARSARDKHGEERALMYLNSFRTFLRMDVNRAMRGG
jgi:hypothetical protein